MTRRSEDARSLRWVSVSEVAEYAYCPRAWWYRSHPPGEVDPESRREAATGVDFHDRRLGAVERRDRWSGALAVAALVLAFLLAAALVGLFLGA